MVEGAPSGTTWICARCARPFDHRDASSRAPDRTRVRIGVCVDCKRLVLNLVARRRSLATDVERLAASGGVRELRPYRHGGAR